MIVVTTDVVDPNEVALSLREAVAAASTNGRAETVGPTASDVLA